MRLPLWLGLAVLATLAGPVHAADLGGPFAEVQFASGPPVGRPATGWRATVTFRPVAARIDFQSPRPLAFQYSHGYEVRNRIHKDASYAMWPLFGAEAWLGVKLYNNPPVGHSGVKTAHGLVAVGIGGLFGLNSVTGVWNLVEGRKDPHRGVLPVVHGILMLVADGGFLATALSAPKFRTPAQMATFDATRSTHLGLATVSISTAVAGYVIMLFR